MFTIQLAVSTNELYSYAHGLLLSAMFLATLFEELNSEAIIEMESETH